MLEVTRVGGKGEEIEWGGGVFVNAGVQSRGGMGENGFQVFELRAGDVDGEVGVVGGNEGDEDFDGEGELLMAEGVGRQESSLVGPSSEGKAYRWG